MADVRQSPLVALMNTLNVQGRTGQTGEAISDSGEIGEKSAGR
jgi:type VI secretion system protein ImpL